MARSLWTGSVSLGLVNIPIALQTAVRENDVSFHQITPCCNARVSQALKCKKCGNEVSRAELKKGYEISKDNIVVLEQEEIEAVKLKTLKSISIEGFVPDSSIDPIQFSTSYYVVAQDGGEKAYNLIADSLRTAKLWALARITTHGKEHTAIVRARDRNLILTTLYYPDEVLEAPTIAQTTQSAREIDLATQLLEKYKMEELDLTKFENGYVKALRELINAKLNGEKLPAVVEEAQPAFDLVKALEISVGTPAKATA